MLWNDTGSWQEAGRHGKEEDMDGGEVTAQWTLTAVIHASFLTNDMHTRSMCCGLRPMFGVYQYVYGAMISNNAHTDTTKQG